jgi:hypothetical protein
MVGGGEKTRRRASAPETTRRRASVPEVIGAWLRIWTPPRDVEVPPVPVRKLLIGAAVTLAVVGGATALIAPRINSAKQRSAAREARERAARRQAERLRVIAEQRPRRGSAADLRPSSGAPAARRLAARAALLARAEQAITADARRRALAGELSGHPGTTECSPYPPGGQGSPPEQDLSRRTGAYDCLVVIRKIPATETNPEGRLGYPFRAVVDFEAFKFVWCKTNPAPGEQVIPDPRTLVELPRACRVAPT